jgi:Tfp pilus assembly protein PilO
MNAEPWTISASMVISLLASALASICVYFVKRVLEKVEQLDAEAVRKRELKELEERLSLDQQEMHEQNRTLMGDIRSDIRELRARIDSTFRGGGR